MTKNQLKQISITEKEMNLVYCKKIKNEFVGIGINVGTSTDMDFDSVTTKDFIETFEKNNVSEIVYFETFNEKPLNTLRYAITDLRSCIDDCDEEVSLTPVLEFLDITYKDFIQTT
jgi:hypothetical protein